MSLESQMNVPGPFSDPNITWLLRAEGLAVAAAALFAYAKLGRGWGFFGSLILVPDLAIAGYLGGPQMGAITYNAAHNYVVALATLGLGFAKASLNIKAAGLIWIAHIGVDRALGFGLKFFEGFKFTHLGSM